MFSCFVEIRLWCYKQFIDPGFFHVIFMTNYLCKYFLSIDFALSNSSRICIVGFPNYFVVVLFPWKRYICWKCISSWEQPVKVQVAVIFLLCIVQPLQSVVTQMETHTADSSQDSDRTKRAGCHASEELHAETTFTQQQKEKKHGHEKNKRSDTQLWHYVLKPLLSLSHGTQYLK